MDVDAADSLSKPCESSRKQKTKEASRVDRYQQGSRTARSTSRSSRLIAVIGSGCEQVREGHKWLLSPHTYP